MRNVAKALKAVATPFSNTAHSDPGRDEPSRAVEPSAGGQLIDMAEWRLLPPVDSGLGGAA
jgi:hypothetical protein